MKISSSSRRKINLTTGITFPGGTLTINFKLYDKENSLIPIGGVSAGAIRFTIAKLDAITVLSIASDAITLDQQMPTAGIRSILIS